MKSATILPVVWTARILRGLRQLIPPRSIEGRNLGIAGERRAVWFYRWRGYSIEERNLRTSDGEIDLIVMRARTVVFVEVKTRQWLHLGEPHEAVNRAKQLQIARLAERYLRSRDFSGYEVRFDVVSIVWTGHRFRLEYFPDAFALASDEVRPWRVR